MFGRITCRSNQISTENRVDSADHLQIILAMAAVPLPPRRPNKAERVDREEDCAECNQSNLEQFFARDVVHLNSPVRKDAGTSRTRWSPSKLTRYLVRSVIRMNDRSSASRDYSSKSASGCSCASSEIARPMSA